MQTQRYYDRHAQGYAEKTRGIDVSSLRARFLRYLRPGAHLLDAGSGSGRDTLSFLEQGYTVEAFDASPALCALSTRFTGIQTRLLRFQDLEAENQYDGIWACASLLHVPEAQLPDAFVRLLRALKDGGAMYVSFKHGAGERTAKDGRFFTDMDADRLQNLIATLPEARIRELWVSAGEAQLQGQGGWLNAIIVKMAQGVGHG